MERVPFYLFPEKVRTYTLLWTGLTYVVFAFRVLCLLPQVPQNSELPTPLYILNPFISN